MVLLAKLQGNLICPRDVFISTPPNLNIFVLRMFFTLFKSQAFPSLFKKQSIESVPATFKVHSESNITEFCDSLNNKQLLI